MENNEQGLLTVKQVSEKLSVSAYTVRKHAAAGVIPAIRIGGAVRFSPEAIEAFIKKGGSPLR